MLYALVDGTDTILKTRTNITPSNARPGLRWIPVNKSSVDISTDPRYFLKETVETVFADRVERVTTKRDMTAQESTARKGLEVDDMDYIQNKVIFELVNRVLVLEGNSTITPPQLKTWIVSKL